jgi:hypothetical protein
VSIRFSRNDWDEDEYLIQYGYGSDMLGLGSRALEWSAGGVLVTLLGILIKFAGWTWLLAGYSESTSAVPDEVVQDLAGSTLLRIGIALLAVGVLAVVTTLPTYLTIVVAVGIMLAVARLLYRLNTWSPSQNTRSPD